MTETQSRGRRPGQLPPGRHGLPRETVVQNQRERILRAVVDVASLAGYGPMSVEDIISTAGVSRRTFYDHFPNKESAFLVAYDESVTRLQAAMIDVFSAEGSIIERATAAVTVLVDGLAADPAMAEMCVVEVLGAGAEAVARRDRSMRELSELIATGAKQARGGEGMPPMTSETIAGGIHEVIYARVLRGELEELREAVPELVYALFLPYAGIEGAQAAHDSAVEFRAKQRATDAATDQGESGGQS